MYVGRARPNFTAKRDSGRLDGPISGPRADNLEMDRLRLDRTVMPDSELTGYCPTVRYTIVHIRICLHIRYSYQMS